MDIFVEFILICWLAFLAYWFLLAPRAKRNIGSMWSWQNWTFRLAVLFIALLVLPRFRESAQLLEQFAGSGPFGSVVNGIGVVLCILGIAFAIWARAHLGRNWSMPMSVKDNPQLVTSGPYALVRHPIYSGLLLALIGSSLVSPAWFVAFVIAFIYLVFSSNAEEKLMLRQFPDAYPAYIRNTKMLIPFVW